MPYTFGAVNLYFQRIFRPLKVLKKESVYKQTRKRASLHLPKVSTPTHSPSSDVTRTASYLMKALVEPDRKARHLPMPLDAQAVAAEG
jgi:hypothetical protein